MRVHNEYVPCQAEVTKYGLEGLTIWKGMPFSVLNGALDMLLDFITDIKNDPRYTVLDNHWHWDKGPECSKVYLIWKSESLRRNFTTSFMADHIEVNVQMDDTSFLSLSFCKKNANPSRVGEKNTGRAICATCERLFAEYNNK